MNAEVIVVLVLTVGAAILLVWTSVKSRRQVPQTVQEQSAQSAPEAAFENHEARQEPANRKKARK